mmetsp:Transcript_14446/g.36837  ORF Transcript_14446/g.36837 Transcript_14446/m.36837 type:complete len:477 (-) Transcript_14446:417-1847(-)
MKVEGAVRRLISQFQRYSTCSVVDASSIRVLNTPTHFFESLLDGVKHAEKSVYLTSLYLGTDSMSKQLVAAIDERMGEKRGLEVTVILDYLRATRGRENSVTVLKPLLEKYPDNVKVFLYHSPGLSGILKKVLPERLNETVSLSHIKYYAFDNAAIFSGANLNDSYFTDRQDRYIKLGDAAGVTSTWQRVLDGVSKLSYRVKPSGEFSQPEIGVVPFEQPSEFKSKAKALMSSLIQPDIPSPSSSSPPPHLHHAEVEAGLDAKGGKALVFSSFQFPHYDVVEDEKLTLALLSEAMSDPSFCLHVASGYFNVTEEYLQVIEGGKGKAEVFLASPKANGFYKARGVAGHIVPAYGLIAKEFFKKLEKRKRLGEVGLHEYSREGWTYHAKGMWLSSSPTSPPFLSTIGSPNYGYRSVKRDNEGQLAIISLDEGLQRQWQGELDTIRKDCQPITTSTFQGEDYSATLLNRALCALCKKYL